MYASVFYYFQFMSQPRPTLIQQIGGTGSVGTTFSVNHPPPPPPPQAPQPRTDISNPPPPIIMMQNRPPTGLDLISAPMYQPRSY